MLNANIITGLENPFDPEIVESIENYDCTRLLKNITPIKKSKSRWLNTRGFQLYKKKAVH